MYIDYSKIITTDLKSFITEEKLTKLKQMALQERNYLRAKMNKDSMKLLFAKRVNEIVYKGSKFQLMNDVEKAIISSNIVFDDEKAAKILATSKFDRDTLETFIKLLNYLKAKAATFTIDENDQKYFDYADNFAKALVVHFTKYIGPTDYNLIINKINELVSFNPELLEKNNKKRTR